MALMSLAVMPVAQDDKQFNKVCRRVESVLNVQKCKARTLSNLQKEGFQTISPSYPANHCYRKYRFPYYPYVHLCRWLSVCFKWL